MKTFAELKRKLTVGTTLVMTRNDWCVPVGNELTTKGNPLLGLPRKIKTVQSNGIQFEPHNDKAQGSWLYFRKAGDFLIQDDTHFSIRLDDAGNIMSYEIIEQAKGAA